MNIGKIIMWFGFKKRDLGDVLQNRLYRKLLFSFNIKITECCVEIFIRTICNIRVELLRMNIKRIKDVCIFNK